MKYARKQRLQILQVTKIQVYNSCLLESYQWARSSLSLM
jgi:hypothetical protein